MEPNSEADEYAVCVLVISEGRVLAISRIHDPSDFGLLGGSVDPQDGEPADPATLKRAAIREAYEEAGIIIDAADLTEIHRGPARSRLAITYQATRYQGQAKLGHGAEGVVDWVEPERLLSGTYGAYNRHILAKADFGRPK